MSVEASLSGTGLYLTYLAQVKNGEKLSQERALHLHTAKRR